MIDRYMMSDITFYQETTFMFPIQIKKLNGNMIYNLTKNKNSNTLFFVCGISRSVLCVRASSGPRTSLFLIKCQSVGFKET